MNNDTRVGDDELRRGIAGLLDALEAELRRQNRWESVMPTAERLTSEIPFCHDTLEYLQWVQWVFIPRFRAVLEGGHSLPSACAIAPAAEISVDPADPKTAALLLALRRIDYLVSHRRHMD